MLSKKDRLEMQVGGTPQQQDPVVSDQAGRMLRSDPVHPIAGSDMPNPEMVRARAYELYEQHGRKDGAAVEHWLQAESELRTKPRPATKNTVSGPEPIGAPELSSRA